MQPPHGASGRSRIVAPANCCSGLSHALAKVHLLGSLGRARRKPDAKAQFAQVAKQWSHRAQQIEHLESGLATFLIVIFWNLEISIAVFRTGAPRNVRYRTRDMAGLLSRLMGRSDARVSLRRAERRVRAFLRRTVEGCQRLEQLDRGYRLHSSVQHGACTAAMTEADMASLKAAYQFMERSNLRALMPMIDKRRPPFFEILSARQLQRRHGTAEGFYAGGVIDRFGGSFRPRKFLIGLARALQKQGVRFFRHTEAQALDFSDHQMTVFCGNGATIAANTLFMANAYARQRIFPALRSLGESDIKRAWAGRVYYTLDDYPFVERRHGGRVVTFAAPSDHGNALALRIGQLVGNVVTHPATRPTNDNDERQRRHSAQQLRLFENFPKGLRLRPGRRYQEAAFREPEPPIPNRPEKKSIRNPLF